jgi:hypothetical protein
MPHAVDSPLNPEIVQVADRFHLARHVIDPLKQLLHSHRWHSPSAAAQHSPLRSVVGILSVVFSTYGSYLLPQAYPESAYLRPAYGAGNATVAGACVTILFPAKERI